LKLFKSASEKAELEFKEAYEKGIRLGENKWPDAAQHFLEAAKSYTEANMPVEAARAYGLAALFTAVAARTDANAWLNCSNLMSSMKGTQLDVGFRANSDDIAEQARVMHDDLVLATKLDYNNPSVPDRLRALGQEYLQLMDKEMVVWKLLRKDVDPAKQAQYLNGLAYYVEANTEVQRDPAKTVSLLAEATSYLDQASIDPLGKASDIKQMFNLSSKTAKCWFCDREVQGLNYHFVTLPARGTAFLRAKYGDDSPPVMEGESVVACMLCYSSIWNLSDEIAAAYYKKAIQELQAVATQLNKRLDDLGSEIRSLRLRIR